MSTAAATAWMSHKHAAQRERRAGFLSSEQLAQVDKAHKAELEDAKAAMSIFGGMLRSSR